MVERGEVARGGVQGHSQRRGGDEGGENSEQYQPDRIGDGQDENSGRAELHAANRSHAIDRRVGAYSEPVVVVAALGQHGPEAAHADGRPAESPTHPRCQEQLEGGGPAVAERDHDGEQQCSNRGTALPETLEDHDR